MVFLSLVIAFPALAVHTTKPTPPKPPEEPALPEINGLYTVPDRPNMLLRVIAHPEKPKKPNHRDPVSMPVCTADNDSGAIVGAAGWHLKNGTTTYRVNYSTIPYSVGPAAAKEAFANSFAAWDSLVDGVTVVEGPVTNARRARFDGQNAIFFGRLSASTIGVTYIWYYLATGEVAEVDTAYNSRFSWSYTPYTESACGNSNSFDLQNIGTHEKGHWFGLDDEYDASYSDNTMYGYGDVGELKKDTLTTGDKAGLSAIYP